MFTKEDVFFYGTTAIEVMLKGVEAGGEWDIRMFIGL